MNIRKIYILISLFVHMIPVSLGFVKKLNFEEKKIQSIPLDEVSTEDIKDRTKALSSH